MEKCEHKRMTVGESEAARATDTLVFIHGSGDSALVWNDLRARLQDYTCLPLDLPGHGATRDRPGPSTMSVKDYADAVRSELTRQQLSGVCLIGHSLGSAIALRLAVDHPSLVSRLVLVGAGARLRVLPALLEEARSFPISAGEKLVQLGFAPDHEIQAARYARERSDTAPGMLYRDLAACDAFDMTAELGRVAQPTLIIVGEMDRLTPPKYATYLRDHLADAHLATVPAAGHYVALEAPDAVASALRQWLERAG